MCSQRTPKYPSTPSRAIRSRSRSSRRGRAARSASRHRSWSARVGGAAKSVGWGHPAALQAGDWTVHSYPYCFLFALCSASVLAKAC